MWSAGEPTQTGHSTKNNKNDSDAAVVLERDSELMTLFFRHIAACPPHGPFKYYSAITFTERVRHWVATQSSEAYRVLDALTPTAVLQLMERHYNTQHLRNWPLLYVPAEVRLKDLDNLIAEMGEGN